MARPPATMPRPSAAPALERWPSAPKNFNELEKTEWKRLGKAAMAAGTVTAADLLVAENAARLMARLQQAYADPEAPLTAINASARLIKEFLSSLGLTPASRKSVEAPAPAKTEGDELDEF